MASGRWHPSSCKECDRQAADGHYISATGLCAECGDQRVLDNVYSLQAHAGPAFQRWRQGMAASVGASLLDERAHEA